MRSGVRGCASSDRGVMPPASAGLTVPPELPAIIAANPGARAGHIVTGPIAVAGAERERRRRVETGIYRTQYLKTAQHEAGRHEEHQGKRDLANHQRALQTRPATTRRGPAVFLERFTNVNV